MNTSRRALHALAVVASMAFTGIAHPQERFPSKPVKFVVPYAAGASADTLSRIVAQGMAQELGQSVVVENRPGATGNIGSAFVAKSAAADGYTMLLGASPNLATNHALYLNPGFDPEKDFAPIALLASAPNVIVANPSVPANSLAELIAYSKSAPAGLSYTTGGIGSQGHLTGEVMKHAHGAKLLHVPAPSPLVMVMAGQVDASISTVLATLQQVRSGKLKAFAITGPTRLAIAPEIPTVGEAGFPDLEIVGWFGLVVPAATPPERRKILHDAVARTLAQPAVRAQLASLGTDVTPMDEAKFGAFISAEKKRWAEVIRRSGAKAE